MISILADIFKSIWYIVGILIAFAVAAGIITALVKTISSVISDAYQKDKEEEFRNKLLDEYIEATPEKRVELLESVKKSMKIMDKKK